MCYLPAEKEEVSFFFDVAFLDGADLLEEGDVLLYLVAVVYVIGFDEEFLRGYQMRDSDTLVCWR